MTRSVCRGRLDLMVDKKINKKIPVENERGKPGFRVLRSGYFESQ